MLQNARIVVFFFFYKENTNSFYQVIELLLLSDYTWVKELSLELIFSNKSIYSVRYFLLRG